MNFPDIHLQKIHQGLINRRVSMSVKNHLNNFIRVTSNFLPCFSREFPRLKRKLKRELRRKLKRKPKREPKRDLRES